MDISISTPKSGNKMKVTVFKSEEEKTKNVKRHKCLICLKSFIHLEILENHIFMAHTNERPYKCTVCGWSSKTLSYLKQHERLHVGEKRHTCSKCSSKFSSWSDRNKHFNQVHDNLWPCEICKRVFKGKEKLARHEQIHSDLKQFVCVICEHPARTLPNLMSHISNLHTREKPFPCVECPSEYSQSSSLKSHIIWAHRKEEWVHKCSVCGKTFASRSQLNRHTKFHTGERPHICKVCGKRFVTLEIRNQHAKIHNKKFSCNICTKMFPSAFFLKDHQKRHTEQGQFKCEECPNSYYEKGQLNNHVRQCHMKIRPFSCSMCDKSFYRVGLRDKHLVASHLNEKHEKCEICHKRLKHGISVHIKRHDELTDLRCSLCPKRFVNMMDLLEHHSTKHVGKPFDFLTCIFCQKVSRGLQSLENHTNRHIRERPHFCGECDSSFFIRRDLNSHTNKYHMK